MYLIVGLGNPEPDYCKTRHNMGFDVINKLAKKYEIDVKRTKFKGLYGSGNIGEEKVILIKPQTYMNLSGQCIKPFMDFYKIPPENVLVIFDDMDVEIGAVRVRQRGSAGKHNGAKSVIHELGTEEFPRIRVGIGKPKEEYSAIDYVIGELDEQTYEQLEKGIDKAVEAVEDCFQNGMDKTMNKYNQKIETNIG